MQKSINLHLRSSSFLLYVALAFCGLMSFIFIFFCHKALLLVDGSVSAVLLILSLFVLLISALCWSYQLHRSVKYSRNPFIHLQFKQGIWTLNGGVLSRLQLLHRCSFGVLLLVLEEGSRRSDHHVCWISTRWSGDAEVRRLSRCFEL